MSNVVPLFSEKPEPKRPATCGCRPDSLCYPHRLTNLADLLRAELAHRDDWLVPRAEVDRITAHVLDVLGGITAECLPPDDDERSAR